MARRRSSGSSTSVASVAPIVATWLVWSVSSATRVEIGTCAASEPSGVSPWRAMCRRSAPDTIASTTSLTLTPTSSFTARTSARLTEANELCRCGPTVPLKHGPATPSASGFRLRCWRTVTPRAAVRTRYSAIFRGVWIVGSSAAQEQLEIGGLVEAGVLDPDRGRVGGRIGLEVEQLLRDAGAGDAVHEAVVELRDQRHLAADDAVDVPHLPQRPAPIELVAHEHAEEVADLPPPARRRDRDAAEVLVDVEVLVLDPHRPVEVERDLLELPAELRHPGQSPQERAPDLVEPEAIRFRRIDQREPADVLVPRGGLGRQEERVRPGESLHASRSLWVRWVDFRRCPKAP